MSGGYCTSVDICMCIYGETRLPSLSSLYAVYLCVDTALDCIYSMSGYDVLGGVVVGRLDRREGFTLETILS